MELPYSTAWQPSGHSVRVPMSEIAGKRGPDRESVGRIMPPRGLAAAAQEHLAAQRYTLKGRRGARKGSVVGLRWKSGKMGERIDPTKSNPS